MLPNEMQAAEPRGPDFKRAVIFHGGVLLNKIHPRVGSVENDQRCAVLFDALNEFVGIGPVEFGRGPKEFQPRIAFAMPHVDGEFDGLVRFEPDMAAVDRIGPRFLNRQKAVGPPPSCARPRCFRWQRCNPR